MARNRAAEYQARQARARALGFDGYAHQRAAREGYKAAHGHSAPRDANLATFARDLTRRRHTDREVRLMLRIDPSDHGAWTSIFSP